MAEQVRAYEVQIKGANSVKELKQEISALRDKLVGLDTSTKEYSDTVEDLIADEKKLKEVMSAGKDSITGATGSYNALVNEMGALKKVWREVADEGKRNQIGKRIAEINDELKSMDSSIGNYQRNVGDYENAFRQALMTPQQELKKLKIELAGLEEGTEAYNQTFQRMSQLTHDVAEQTEQLKWSSADLGDILGNLAGVAQGVAGGFSAINAVQGLIGSGNEDVEKAMLTTQRWIQLIQGLGAVEELGDKITGLWTGLKQFTKEANASSSSMGTLSTSTRTAGASMGGFSGMVKGAIVNVKALAVSIKTALISSGIGLLIVALGTAVSWLWKFVDGSAKAEKITNDVAKSTELLNKTLSENEKVMDREVQLLEAQGASYEEIYQAKRKHILASLSEVSAELAKQQAIANSIGQKKLESDAYKDFNDKLKETIELEKKLREQLDDLDYDRNVIQPVREATKETKKLKEAELELSKEREESYNKQQEMAKNLYEDLVEYYKNDTQKRKEEYDRQLRIIEKWNATVETKERARHYAELKYEEETRKERLSKLAEQSKWESDWRARQIELLGADTEEGLLEQLNYHQNFLDQVRNLYEELNNIRNNASFSEEEKNVKINKKIEFFNASENTEYKVFEDVEQGVKIAQKAVKDVNDSLSELDNNKVLLQLGKNLTKLGNDAVRDLNNFDLKLEELASDSDKFIWIFKGWREGISPKDTKKLLEERYNMLEEQAQREIDIYNEALYAYDEVNEQYLLTGEERKNVEAQRVEAIMKLQDVLTQKIIDSNYLQIESFKNVSDSIIGMASSLGDIFGTIGDSMMDSVEAQREAGDISQEEYERQFEKAKAFQTAQAIINTIAGAVGAFMGITKDTGGWGIALAIAQATAVFASGMAQVKKIQETEPKKGGGGSESVRFAEVTPSATSDFRPELTQNATGGQETENLANALSKNPIKAYVVESDISSAQSKAQQRTKESTF